MSTTTFFLVRHGESTWNAAWIVQGHADESFLTPRGLEQAAVAATELEGCGATMVVSSDLQRARQTAEVIARRLGLPHRVDVGLRERNYGTLEGASLDEAAPHLTDVAGGRITSVSHQPGGGESLGEFHRRVDETLRRLAGEYPDQTVIIATHGGVIRVLRAVEECADLVGATWRPVGNAEVWRYEVSSQST